MFLFSDGGTSFYKDVLVLAVLLNNMPYPIPKTSTIGQAATKFNSLKVKLHPQRRNKEKYVNVAIRPTTAGHVQMVSIVGTRNRQMAIRSNVDSCSIKCMWLPRGLCFC